ncbi:hypothetical protein [Deinococcus yunweiensis]|uniref:hypothetical protein n=1 Tax=Deinococcus yunweiensis TaxID=367282 RepID=UPI00398F30D3
MKARVYDFSRVDGSKHVIDLLTMPTGISWMLNLNPIQRFHRDLLDLLRAVQIADRYTPRPTVNGHRETSARIIEVILPVRDLARWTRPDVHASLVRALHFLTQDTWVLRFVPRTLLNEDTPMSRLDLGSVQGPRSFGLFSGGLDSVAGTALLLHGQPTYTHVAVSATGSNLTELHDTTVESIERDVKQSGPGRPYPLAGVRYHTPVMSNLIMQHFGDQRPREEYTQRSRGFVFLGLGAAIAHQDGQSSLYVFEHGVGAINLGYNAAVLGVDMTRAMHPYAVALMAQFLSLFFDSPFNIQNPHWFQSKGQVLNDLKRLGSADLVVKSRSCDAHRNRNQPPEVSPEVPHCGSCSSCILRRLATSYAGVPDTRYGTDPVAVLRSRATPPRRALNTYVLMRKQYETLSRALRSRSAEQRFLALLTDFPELRLAYDGFRMLGFSPERTEAGIVDMYASYVHEWDMAQNKRGGTRA